MRPKRDTRSKDETRMWRSISWTRADVEKEGSILLDEGNACAEETCMVGDVEDDEGDANRAAIDELQDEEGDVERS